MFRQPKVMSLGHVISRSRENDSHLRDGSSTVSIRPEAIPGPGQPAWEVLITDLRAGVLPTRVVGKMLCSTRCWKFKKFLTVCSELLMYCHGILVPRSLQRETKIHTGHQGIKRCRAQVTASVWWPGVSQQVAQTVTLAKEPLIVSQLPDYPWKVVWIDLFKLSRKALSAYF